MASNINPYIVDGTFPVAGQDNSSQGFRDNFTNIKNNFAFAASEITDLQAKAIVTSALSGQSVNNDMSGTQIARPQLKSWTQTFYDNLVIGVGNTVVLDFNTANFQKITTTGTAGTVYLNFINWPATAGYGTMRVWFVIANPIHTITLPPALAVSGYGVTDIAGFDPATGAITFDAAGNYIFDFSQDPITGYYHVFDVSRNRATLRDPNFYYNNQVNGTILVGYGTAAGLATIKPIEAGQNVISAHGSYNSTAYGNLNTANVTYTTLNDGQSLGGYTVTAARGNIRTGTIQPVQSNDPLGFVSSYAFTGNSIGNSFQVSSSIIMYATGSNVTYGLGGNIAFYTADDGGGLAGGGTQGTIYQAMSINNDQTVQVMGALRTDGAVQHNGMQYVSMTYTNNNAITVSNTTSVVILDSLNGTTVPSPYWANLSLPQTPANGQRIVIHSNSAIQQSNLYAAPGSRVNPAYNNLFYNGGAGRYTADLIYVAQAACWYDVNYQNPL